MKNINAHNRDKCLKVRLNSKEYQTIKNNFAKTTYKYMSEYIRKMLLKKPVIGSYRDQTMEDLMNVLVELKNGLNSIGNSFNLIDLRIKKLPPLQHFTEYRA